MLIQEIILVEESKSTPEILATVKSNNISSLTIFKSLGFSEQSREITPDDEILLKIILSS